MSNPPSFNDRLGDPAFRRRLHQVGWKSRMAVYELQPGETYEQVRERMGAGRHLLVAEDPSEPFGLRMAVIQVDG